MHPSASVHIGIVMRSLFFLQNINSKYKFKISIMKTLNSIICLFLGHKPKRMLVENEYSIFTNGCSRCGCGLGLPAMWKSASKIYPPNSTLIRKKNTIYMLNKKCNHSEFCFLNCRLTIYPPLMADIQMFFSLYM